MAKDNFTKLVQASRKYSNAVASMKGIEHKRDAIRKTNALKNRRIKEAKAKQQNQINAFAAMYSQLGALTKNDELIKFAKKQGFETVSGPVTNIFNDPIFEKNGIKIKASQMEGLMQLQKMKDTSKMLEIFEDPKDKVEKINFDLDQVKYIYNPRSNMGKGV